MVITWVCMIIVNLKFWWSICCFEVALQLSDKTDNTPPCSPFKNRKRLDNSVFPCLVYWTGTVLLSITLCSTVLCTSSSQHCDASLWYFPPSTVTTSFALLTPPPLPPTCLISQVWRYPEVLHSFPCSLVFSYLHTHTHTHCLSTCISPVWLDQCNRHRDDDI